VKANCRNKHKKGKRKGIKFERKKEERGDVIGLGKVTRFNVRKWGKNVGKKYSCVDTCLHPY
jgi:hypothetical protein